MTEKKNELIRNIKEQLNEKNEKKQELLSMINSIDNEIENIKCFYLKKILEMEIPKNPIQKIRNIQIKIDPSTEWKFSYDHVGYPNEKLYNYKRYPFTASIVDVEDNEASDVEYGTDEQSQERDQSQERKTEPSTITTVELAYVNKNKYTIKVNGQRSRFTIFIMDGMYVVYNVDYKFDLPNKAAQHELIKNYTYVDEIPEAVALSILLLIIEKGWSPIDDLHKIF